MEGSSDDQTQPEASAQQAGSATSNEGSQPEASSEGAQPDTDANWMKTESIRGAGEGREEFLRRLRDPDKERGRR
jgi:hypothetical protein